jgi:proteasome accessory factor A
MVLDRWESVLTALETDPMSLAGQLDWVAKRRMVEAYKERHGLGWSSPKLAALDLQYHDVSPGRSLFARLGLERLTTEDEVLDAVTEPPRSTRAYFRSARPPPVAPRRSSRNCRPRRSRARN